MIPSQKNSGTYSVELNNPTIKTWSCPQIIDLILYNLESIIIWGHCNHF